LERGSSRIILFAKAPVRGRVKTRLQVSAERALALHDAFVRDTLEMLAAFPDVELSTDAATDAWSEYGLARSVQAPGDLGAKLYAAIAGALADGYRRVLVLGSDSPTLPAAHVSALLDSAADVALGPTEDGGYYGICCRRAAGGMFDGVEWSSARTLATTMCALEKAGLTVELGPAWYDVDLPADLERLAREGFDY
jgi:rSAM/selenodomain-associated transferase 1